MAVGLNVVEPERYTRSDLRELRLGGLPLLLAIFYVATVGFALLPLAQSLADRFWVPVVSPLVALGIFFVSQRQAWLAGVVLIITLIVSWVAALLLLPGEATALLAIIVIGAASALFGPRATFVGAALCTVALVVVGHVGQLNTATTDATVLISWVVASLFWFAARPSDRTLEWAWASYADARDKHDQLRRHQGELHRVLKSLDVAYRRLEHLNDELNRARQDAEKARRLKGEFAMSISHELRTPLNLILGFSEMMVATPVAYGNVRLPPAYQADIDAIYRNAQHLAGLIDDVLDLSQIEAGRMGLARERADLSRIIGEATQAVAARFANLGLAVELPKPVELPPVSADRTRIRQVLINLLNNATRFTDRGGVRITVEHRGHDVVISVADTGVGIAPADLPHVFDEFFQANSALQRRAGGSGLGLTISKRIVELHGGTMWVESADGAGATFSFTLPLAANVVIGGVGAEWEIWDRVSRDRSPPAPVLVVRSDDEMTRRTFTRYFDDYRLRLLPADGTSSGEDAEEDAPKGTIVTASSPSECWQELCRAGDGESDQPVAVVAVSSVRSRAAELGVIEYLSKPITRQQVEQVLRRFGRTVRTILVVDDNADMVRLLARTIRQASRRCQVWQATTGREALAILSEHQPDAILLDLLMPDIDGYAVLARMRADERLRSVPVVAMSGGGIGTEAMTIDLIGITRLGGLSVDETMKCLKGCFDALRSVSPRGEQAPRGERDGLPASPADPRPRGSARAPLPAAPSTPAPECRASPDDSSGAEAFPSRSEVSSSHRE